MPEGKKKDSFTFSDKIKNSKPAGSKSFANRIFSKIGKDGKPRQTLYERTRRDAPFFIAAVIALLLLPFLYKYSGSVGDENEMTPIKGDLLQDPDSRDGYYSFVDPGSSTLAPYPGNDTALLLVKPFAGEDSGAITEEQVPDVNTPSTESKRDSYADATASKKASKLRDKETNILNEYRKRAGATTRKAFKRTPTKINTLGSAGMRRPNGSKLGVNMWGGGLKNAAGKVKPSGPTEGPKPVSLQPLTAAGKPSRASFGQGHLAAAQKSKDAMSKGNPMEALRDAQVRALGNNRTGGMDFDRNPFGPGGGGSLKHDFNYQGREPWWWDMMKTRMQAQWQRMFDYKWGWIDWGTDLIRTWMKGLLNCLFMGNSDGDPDTFFGSGGGVGGKEATCCGVKQKNWEGFAGNIPFDENTCKGLIKKPEYKGCSGWVAGRDAGAERLNGVQVRLKCLGIAVKGTAPASVNFEQGHTCVLFEQTGGRIFNVPVEGEARKWNTYIYVMAKNQLPETLRKLQYPDAKDGKALLCSRDRFAITSSGKKVNYGVGSAEQENNSTKGSQSGTHAYGDVRNKDNYDSYMEDCVVAITTGDVFDYDAFETQMISLFVNELKKAGYQGGDIEKKAREIFEQELVLTRIEAMVAKDKLAYLSHTLKENALPMPYYLFKDAYIIHKGATSNPVKKKYTSSVDVDVDDEYDYVKNSENASGVNKVRGNGIPARTVIAKMGWRTEEVDRFWGDNARGHGYIGCDWTNRVALECVDTEEDQDNVAGARVTFINLAKAVNPLNLDNVIVTASFKQDDSVEGGYQQVEQLQSANFSDLQNLQGDGFHIRGNQIWVDFGGFTGSNVEQGTTRDLHGTVTWVVKRKSDGAVVAEPKTCSFKSQAAPETKESTDTAEETVTNNEPPDPSVSPLVGSLDDQSINPRDLPCGEYKGKVLNSYWAAKYGSQVIAQVNEKLKADKKKVFPWVTGSADYEINGTTFSVSEGEGEEKGFVPFGKGGSRDSTNYLPTMVEFMAVMKIAQREHINIKVPKNAVCALGGLLTAVSEDKSFLSDANITNAKLRTNGFGAFLAYIGSSAALWPSNRTSQSPDKRNPRFQGIKEGKIKPTVPQAYHWGHYIQTSKLSDEDKAAGKTPVVVGLYKQGYFAKSGNPYPLKEMIYDGGYADFNGYGLKGKSRAELMKARKAYTEFYSQVLGQHEGYSAAEKKGDMCRDAGNNNWMYKEDGINVDDVMEYLDRACGKENPAKLSFKPWGFGSKEYGYNGKISQSGSLSATISENNAYTDGTANAEFVQNNTSGK